MIIRSMFLNAQPPRGHAWRISSRDPHRRVDMYHTRSRASGRGASWPEGTEERVGRAGNNPYCHSSSRSRAELLRIARAGIRRSADLCRRPRHPWLRGRGSRRPHARSVGVVDGIHRRVVSSPSSMPRRACSWVLADEAVGARSTGRRAARGVVPAVRPSYARTHDRRRVQAASELLVGPVGDRDPDVGVRGPTPRNPAEAASVVIRCAVCSYWRPCCASRWSRR